MTDVAQAEGTGKARIATPGLTDLAVYDLWLNTADFQVIVTDPALTNVKVRYRERERLAESPAFGEWKTVTAVAGADYTYTDKPSTSPQTAITNTSCSSTMRKRARYTISRPQRAFSFPMRDSKPGRTAKPGTPARRTKSARTAWVQAIPDSGVRVTPVPMPPVSW